MTQDFQDQSTTIGKLAIALSKVQGKIRPAVKDSLNPFFKTKYADLSSCWDAARDQLAANELAVVQTTDFVGDHAFVVTTLMHSSGEWTKGRYRVKPVKDDPQSWGSAITYARRYSFSAIIGVVTGEDDDGHHATQAPARRQESKPSNEELATWRDVIGKELAVSADPSVVWKSNKSMIEMLKNNANELYNELIKVAADRKSALNSTTVKN